MPDLEFSDKFIAFVDILGFKEIVQQAEVGESRSLAEISELLADLGDPEDIDNYKPSNCPDAPRIKANVDFQLTQISDCVVISTEPSPAGVINLLSYCWLASIKLLMRGALCRGYVTRGSIYHTAHQFIGSGYVSAYQNESKVAAFRHNDEEIGTPFIEVDHEVVAYVAEHPENYVKQSFERFTRRDGEFTVIFPFHVLAHDFIFGGPAGAFDAQKELEGVEHIRGVIGGLKKKVLASNLARDKKAQDKVAIYLRMLDHQLGISHTTEKFVRALSGGPCQLPR